MSGSIERRHSRISFLSRGLTECRELPGTSNTLIDNRYRLVILGSGKVGKTSIVQQFIYDRFPEAHTATLEELHKTEYIIQGIGIIKIEILDTSGSFPFPAMQRLAITSGKAFILVYAINDKESFDEVKRIVNLVKEIKTEENIAIVIVGNKSDLEDERLVSKEYAEFESIDWEVGFVECSAKTNENIFQIFQQLLLQAHLKGEIKSYTRSSSSSSKSSKIPSNINANRRASLPVNELLDTHLTYRRQTTPKKGRKSCHVS